MDRKKRLDRVNRRLKRFEQCRRAIEQELYRFVANDARRGPEELCLVKADGGVSTLTFFVDCDRTRSYVLRCLLRRREVRHLPEIYAICQKNSLRTPRLLGKYDGFWHRLKIGFHLFLEEFIEAEPIEKVLRSPDRQSPVLYNLARCLAELHDITRREYGPVAKPELRPFLAYYVKKAIRKLDRIQRTVSEISTQETESIGRFLIDKSKEYGRATTFSLVHGDPSDGNILVDNANRVTLVDLEYMHFGIHQYDLQMVRHYILKDDDGLFNHFKRTYDLLRENKPEESQRLDILCRLFVLLRSLPLQSPAQRTEEWWEQWREIQALGRNGAFH